MSKKNAKNIISSYRKKQKRGPYIIGGLAILLAIAGIVLLVIYLVGGGNGIQISLFASETPTPTLTITPTPVTPTSTSTNTPTITNTPTQTATSTPSAPFEYVVQEGDNCTTIAEQFDADKLYDMIYMLRSFHHLNDPDEAMRNIVSMLAYNGRLYIVDWKAGGGSLKDRLHTIFKKREKHYSLEEAEKIVKNSGLEITESYETESFIVIGAVNRHYTAVFPVKNSALSKIEDADEFIVKTEATDRKTDVMPDYCNVLFSPDPRSEEFLLREKGVKVYYSRGGIRENIYFLNALSNKKDCRWNDTCPVGRRTQRGEISPYWTENYCLINNNDCIRFQLEKKGEYHSDIMLPDGSEYKRSMD